MRVLYLPGYRFPVDERDIPFCGALYSPLSFSTALVRLGHEVHVLSKSRPLDPPYQRFRGLHIHRFRSLELASGQSIVLGLRRLRLLMRLVKEASFDAAVAVAPAPLEAYFLRRSGVPLVYRFEGVNTGFARNLQGSFPGWLKRQVIRHVSRRLLQATLRHCIRVSASAFDDALEIERSYGVPREEIRVIRNGVDLEWFCPNGERLQDRLRPDLRGKRLVAFLGRISPEKGVHLLLTAAPRVLAEHPEVHFLIIGAVLKGSMGYKKHLLNLARELDIERNVTFAFDLPDDQLPLYLRSADVMVAFSQGYDPLPNAMLQAMACGCPVVSTDWPARRELIRHGENGVLVPEGNVDALVQRLNWLLGDPPLLERLSVSARRTIEQEHDIRKLAKQMEELLDDARRELH